MSTDGGATSSSLEQGNSESERSNEESVVAEVDDEHSLERPNKEKFDREVSRINKDIKEKETQLKSLVVVPPSKENYYIERDRLHNDLKATKERRDDELSEKKKVDEELRSTNETVQLKNEEIAKYKSKMPYKNEKKIDAAIMRLENQLQRRHLKPVESKELNQEIERLKSSKENLESYKELRTGIDQLKEKQKTLRAKRDEHCTALSNIRQEEDAIKGNFTELKLKADLEWNKYRTDLNLKDGLKKELDELYRKKKETSYQYHQKMTSYQKQIKESRRKSRPALPPLIVKSASMKTLRVTKKPYDDQITACVMLISYLEKTFPSHHSDVEDAKPITTRGSADQLDSMARDTGDQLSGIYSGIRRRPSKRERKQKKHQTAPELLKKCVHHPTVLSQFLLVDVLPPVTVADIVVSIQQLEEKKDYFLAQQKDLEECATNLVTRGRSLEHLGDTRHNKEFHRSTSSASGNSCESELRESDADSSPHRTRQTSESLESSATEVLSGDDATESDSPMNRKTEENHNDISKDVHKNDENDNLQDVTSPTVNRVGKSKVQFCIGDEAVQVHKKVGSDCIDEKMLINYNGVSALGRSKSLDSFRALHKELDRSVTCRRARSISEKLSYPTESFPDFGVVRSEF